MLYGALMLALAIQTAGGPSLAGEVVDPLGQRIVGATVILEPSGEGPLETRTDARGTFRFERLVSGSYSLTATSPGFAAETTDVEVAAGGETNVSLQLELVNITSQLTVTAPSPDGYGAVRAAAATRLNIPIIETPFSVQVVPTRVIEDQNALGLEDVYMNISGVAQAGNTLNAQTEVRPMIRGFEAAVPLRNGLRATTVGAVDSINIESVEVLKGPASILYGALEPGGVLNYTTKKPLMAPRFEVTQQFGADDHVRTTFDATGPLNSSRTMAYRLNVARQDAGSFRDHVDLERLAVMPSLTFRDDRNEVFVDFSFSTEEVPYDTGVPLGLDDDPIVPIDTYFGDPNLRGRDLDDYFTSVGFFRHLNDSITFRSQFQFHRVHALNESIRPRGVRGTPGAETLRRRYQNEDRTDDDYQFVADVISTFDVGLTSHEALVGFDLAFQDSEFFRYRENLADILITANPEPDFTPPVDQPLQEIFGNNRWAAVYFQDQISMLEDSRLHLLFGGRYDTFRGEGESDGIVQPATEEGKLTGRFGAGYEVVPSVLAFASVSQSFLPQNPGTVDFAGNLLDPQTGLQCEGGIKFELFEGRFLTTFSAYHIRKENVAVVDLPLFQETGQIVYFPGVAERSRGFEADLSGRLSDGLSLVANYSYNDAETVEHANEPTEVGQRLGNTPSHLSRIWLAYQVPTGRVRGLGAGFGIRAQSSQRPQFDTFELDGYTVADLGLWYRLPLEPGRQLRFQVNIANLFDKEHYLRASDRSIVHPGTPRSATATIGIEF